MQFAASVEVVNKWNPVLLFTLKQNFNFVGALNLLQFKNFKPLLFWQICTATGKVKEQ